MATITVDSNTTYNLNVQSIPGTTSSTGGSSFNVNSTSVANRTALASPGQFLSVQIGIENSHGEPNTCTITVTDSYKNQSFQGVAIISWEQGDTNIVWIQFNNFPVQADQVTPMDKCEYFISISGAEVEAQIYTL